MLTARTNKWFGESNKLVAGLFSLARKVQPSIVSCSFAYTPGPADRQIFIDEIDSLFRERSTGDHEVTAMMKAEFMTCVLSSSPHFFATQESLFSRCLHYKAVGRPHHRPFLPHPRAWRYKPAKRHRPRHPAPDAETLPHTSTQYRPTPKDPKPDAEPYQARGRTAVLDARACAPDRRAERERFERDV
jgi:hypothetical protein